MAKQLITVQTIISGHTGVTGIITQTKESETVHFNTEMLDSNEFMTPMIFKCAFMLVFQITLRKQQKIADFFL